MGRRPKYFDLKTEFMKHVEKNPVTHCWEWKLNIFRFRINYGWGSVVINPRRYAAYINGYNIQVSRQVKNACQNPKCVNPEHTCLKHNRKPIDKHTPFFLTFEELRLGSNTARVYYGRTMAEMRDARSATIEIIRRIKKAPVKFDIVHICNMFNVGPHFAKKARELTYEEFKELKEDKNDTGDAAIDENGEELLPDAELF